MVVFQEADKSSLCRELFDIDRVTYFDCPCLKGFFLAVKSELGANYKANALHRQWAGL
jgi:hypothetical protein